MEIIKLKAKPGFNIFIKDLGIALRSEVNDWVEVEKEKFEKSLEVNRVRKFIIVDGLDNIEEKETSKNEDIKMVAEGAFVRDGYVQTNPDDVFVAKPTTSPEATKLSSDIEPKKQEIVEPVEAKPEVKPEIKETTEEVKVEDTKPEVKEATEELNVSAKEVDIKDESTTDTKTEEVKEESKPKKAAGRPKKNK